MEMSDNDLAFKLCLENMAAIPAFEDLLDLAIDTCLSSREAFNDALISIKRRHEDERDCEAQIVEKVGLWGLKSSIDIAERSDNFNDETWSGYPGPIHFDLLSEPKKLPLLPDKDVQDTIEAFGKVIIDEAFECLGPDAHQKAKEY